MKSWGCLGICREGKGRYLIAMTDTAAVLYYCSETDLGYTLRYLDIYSGDSIQVGPGIQSKELPSVAQREAAT